MKKVTIIKKPGSSAYKQAQDEAINQGWNCYSKPYHIKDLWDYRTETEEGYYFSKNLQVLEVIVKNELPLLVIEDNKVKGISFSDRKPAHENEMCKQVGLMATCNSCDRIIFEDENYMEQYVESGGYCKECAEQCQEPKQTNIFTRSLFD